MQGRPPCAAPAGACPCGDGFGNASVDASYACETGAYALFRMDARYGNAALPSVWIADMREELQMGNRSILSGKLREEIEKRLEKKEQVVLFLNRRGYAASSRAVHAAM